MRYLVSTLYSPCTIAVKIHAIKACVIHLNVYDAEIPNTFFTKRFKNFVAGEKNILYVQMPISGKNAVVELFCGPGVDPASFIVEGISKIGLARQINVATLKDQNAKNFISFAQRFCFNASVLPAYDDRNYVSDNGQFQIKYSTTIPDNHATPARINKITKIIEVSKEKFVPMTVPMRFCILCHEFSHLFLNQDMYNELEADLNGLTIYLGLGYPRYEAFETFLQTFYQAPSDENLYGRYQHIENFINEFENLNITHL